MSADLREVMRDRACHVLADAIGECPDDPSAAAGEDPGACLSIADGFADLAEIYTADLDRRAELAERDLESALTERDELQEIADKLAYAIAPEEVIGEHSTGNDPWQNAIDYLDVRDAEAEKRGAQELQRRIGVVLAWHNPVESEYRDADGNVTRTVTECAHCSTLADDGVDWPCATASALGATFGEVTLP